MHILQAQDFPPNLQLCCWQRDGLVIPGVLQGRVGQRGLVGVPGLPVSKGYPTSLCCHGGLWDVGAASWDVVRPEGQEFEQEKLGMSSSGCGTLHFDKPPAQHHDFLQNAEHRKFQERTV